MSDFDDVTQFMPIKSGIDSALYIQVLKNGLTFGENRAFTRSFAVGRGENNDIVIHDSSISRAHLEFKYELGEWYMLDLGSTNGTLIDEVVVNQDSWVNLPIPCIISFGASVTTLQLSNGSSVIETHTSSNTADVTVFIDSDLVDDKDQKPIGSKEEIERRFLSTDDNEDIGDYTRMVRGVIASERKKQVKWRRAIISVSVILLFVISTLVIYQQISINKARKIAIEMFYDVKMLEVDLSSTELQLKQGNSSVLQQAALQKRVRLEAMQSKYQAYLGELKSMDFKQMITMSRDDELIQKVARDFGESELELPDGFVLEVKKYIEYWKKTPRIIKAMAFMRENNYLPIMIDAMEHENLPSQFLYLSLQESNFNPRAVGPETRFGIAKGAWQFLPSTGEEFGLRPGELFETREFDAGDERFDFEKATYAAAKYLKHIYTTEAQASGLLVMAGYNFGHNRVKRMIREMPDNPRDRNFWRFFKQYEEKIPKETRDYVFYIFSAAVIGEDPAHFGFKFESPIHNMSK